MEIFFDLIDSKYENFDYDKACKNASNDTKLNNITLNQDENFNYDIDC